MADSGQEKSGLTLSPPGRRRGPEPCARRAGSTLVAALPKRGAARAAAPTRCWCLLTGGITLLKPLLADR